MSTETEVKVTDNAVDAGENSPIKAGIANLKDGFTGKNPAIGGAIAGGVNAIGAAANAALDGAIGWKADGVDAIANGAASIAAKFPMPWGAVASAGIHGLNALSKLGGEKVAGFDGNTGSSGMADFSTADQQFRANPLNPASFFTKSKAAAAADAHNQMMAEKFTAAKNIVEEQNLQNEARQATLQETMMETQQELSGGVDYDSILLKEGGQILNTLEYDLNTIFDYYTPSIKDGGVIEDQYNLDTIFDYYNPIEKFQKGGNLLPSGALHKNKHNMQVDILDGQITKKGIPVVSIEEGGEVIQHAEIEAAEIIFELSVTKKLEKYWQDGSEEAMIKAGELLVEEILNNTDDNVDLIKQIKNENKNKEQNIQSAGGGDTYGVV